MHTTSCNRTWGICKALHMHFQEVVVISTTNRHKLRQEPEDLGDVVVYDASTYDYRTVFQHNKTSQSSVSAAGKKSLIGSLAQKLTSSFPFLYVFGEGGRKYIQAGVKLGRMLIKEKGISHIFSSFSPYADHIIAYKLKKEFPHIFWVADFRDLHIDPTQSNLFFRGYQQKMNRLILSEANLVTTVSEGLATHLRQIHSRVYVLQNGIDNFPNIESKPEEDKFTITYTGSLFGDKRDPALLVMALKELCTDPEFKERIRVRYAGKDGVQWNTYFEAEGLMGIVDNLGLVSRRESLKLQKKSHLNILLTYSSNDLKGNVTGKVYEYLAAERPIVTIINGPRDEELEQMVDRGMGMVIYPGDVDRLKEYILTQYQFWTKGKMLSIPGALDVKFEKMKWVNVIDSLLEEMGSFHKALN